MATADEAIELVNRLGAELNRRRPDIKRWLAAYRGEAGTLRCSAKRSSGMPQMRSLRAMKSAAFRSAQRATCSVPKRSLLLAKVVRSIFLLKVFRQNSTGRLWMRTPILTVLVDAAGLSDVVEMAGR